AGADRVIQFRLQNKNIVLTPFTGGLAAYETELEKLTKSLNVVFYFTAGCYWKRTPRLLLALESIYLELNKTGEWQGVVGPAYGVASLNQPQCGDAKQFFIDYVNEYK
ncbi:MAG: hypothetical protein NTY70_03885, partial [Burkholderiales bacterium]|nr:hypothetical protein [Burkholderiales bacterium]